ncbi:hypothetical protein [Streptomyces sp. NPDC057413]|uniref:hypothetical protein n=1 Tax=Streptomyces sp. NPDC057413 TaxID=3346124 RepID=UPI003681E7C2
MAGAHPGPSAGWRGSGSFGGSVRRGHHTLAEARSLRPVTKKVITLAGLPLAALALSAPAGHADNE